MKSAAVVLIASACVAGWTCSRKPEEPAVPRVSGAAAPPASTSSAPPRVLPHAIPVIQSDRNPVNTTDADVKKILSEAVGVLATNDGAAANGQGDVACPAPLALAGSVVKKPFLNIVEGPSDLRAICQEPGVHVVVQINWCGEPRPDGNTNYLGCAEEPGRCIVVVRAAEVEGILWAHEFGHTRGRPHPCRPENCGSAEADRLMHPFIEPAHVKVDADECKAIQQ